MSVLPEDITITTGASFSTTLTFPYVVTTLSYYAQIRDMQGNLICDLTTAKSGSYDVIFSLSRTQVDTLFIPSSGEDWIKKLKWNVKEVHTPVTDERLIIEKAYVYIIEGTTETP